MEDATLMFLFGLADRHHRSVEEIMEWSTTELMYWSAYLGIKENGKS